MAEVVEVFLVCSIISCVSKETLLKYTKYKILSKCVGVKNEM